MQFRAGLGMATGWFPSCEPRSTGTAPATSTTCEPPDSLDEVLLESPAPKVASLEDWEKRFPTMP